MAVVKKKRYLSKSLKNGRAARVQRNRTEYAGINGSSLLSGSMELLEVDEESQSLVMGDDESVAEFEQRRLAAESMNAITHDESDTISFRNYLLANYLRGANYFNALTIHNVPVSRIKPPKLFQSPISLMELKKMIELQKAGIGKIKAVMDTWIKERESMVSTEHTKFYKSRMKVLDTDGLEGIHHVVKNIESRLGGRLQDRAYHLYDPEVFGTKFRGDMREAPEDYWEKYPELVKERKEKEAKMLREKEEEELRKKEEEERRKREEEEAKQRQQLEDDQLKRNQQPSETPSGALPLQITVPLSGAENSSGGHTPAPGMVTASMGNSSDIGLGTDQQPQPLPVTQEPLLNVASAQIPPQDQAQDIENVFGEYEAEPFNTGFDDEFADLDKVFF